MIKQLLPHAKGYIWYAVLSPLMILGEVFFEVQIPSLMGQIIDVGINGGAGLSFIVNTGIKMVLMAMASLLMGSLAARFAAKAGMGFGANIRSALFQKVQDFSFANIDKFSTASLITRMTTDANTIQNGFMMMLRVVVRAPAMFIMALVKTMQINLRLSLVVLVVIPVLAAALALITKVSFPRFQAMLKKYDKLNAKVQENLIAVRVVKAFVRAQHEKEQFKITNDELTDVTRSAEKVIVLNQPLMMLSAYACIVGVLYIGGGYVVQGILEIGKLTSLITYINQILMSLMMISMIFVMFVMSRASITRVSQVLNETPDINDDNADPTLQVQTGSIAMRDVSFCYNKEAEEMVLSGINLTVHSGETIGIIGGTGSAKTTLVQLIPRLYDITEGELLVGGEPVERYTLHTLRDAVAMVLQTNTLFSGTIAENLRWGNPQATDEELVHVCKIAQAHDFVTAFPEGYQSHVEQGGVNLSGGQKQRLCIARALLKQPKILILDDSTSAVDTATDAKLRDALKEEAAGMTTIIIAQRISSVAAADRIVVLDDGKINAIGTHEELLESNEIYRDVYKQQQEGRVA